MFPALQGLAASLASILAVPADAELWFDATDMPILREDAKDAASSPEPAPDDPDPTLASDARIGGPNAGLEPNTEVERFSRALRHRSRPPPPPYSPPEELP